MDEGRQPLSRKLPIASSKINPYRMIIIIRLVVAGFFFHYRVTHPVNDAYPLWLISVICEIWFAISWILDQFPKWLPIERETYLDRLSLRWVFFFFCFCYFWLRRRRRWLKAGAFMGGAAAEQVREGGAAVAAVAGGHIREYGGSDEGAAAGDGEHGAVHPLR